MSKGNTDQVSYGEPHFIYQPMYQSMSVVTPMTLNLYISRLLPRVDRQPTDIPVGHPPMSADILTVILLVAHQSTTGGIQVNCRSCISQQ